MWCPDWAAECELPHNVRTLTSKLGAVQGLVATTYSVGLAALAFAAHFFNELVVLPLLHQGGISNKPMEAYTEASQDLDPAASSALSAISNLASLLVLSCTILITLSP